MGCQSSRGASIPGTDDAPNPFLAIGSGDGDQDLEAGSAPAYDSNYSTSKRSRFVGAIKSGAKSGAQLGTGIVSSGSSLVQRSTASIIEGGGNILSAADPRRLVASSSKGEYLPVEDADAAGAAAGMLSPGSGTRDESKRRWRICAWLWSALVWAACMSAGLFLFQTGIMPAFFGTRISYFILAVIASPVLIPVVKALIPVVNSIANSLKGTKCYMWTIVIAMWCFLAWVLMVLWQLGIMQVVIGVISAQAIMFICIILLIIPCLAYALPKIKEFIFAIPGKVKEKLWQIPPAVLPLVESMMSGLLTKMEERILAKLATMPKDVACAVTRVGSGAVDLGKKGAGKVKNLGLRTGSGLRRMSTKSSGNSQASGYQSD
eukprot:TRINITY_DN15594_c0_g1_i1.p1 TRINITY_DN15594_c0_g1~~TRINITY_DN15594_c0_g1_i1.p1  ORF type:complete len:376 (-),score=57.40 TRINITY_DN15594_c0_g1_i1:482-1609(-)